MIRHVEIINFKSHKHTKLDFSNLTVFCGTNGSGKSSVIQSLLLLRESYLERAKNPFEYLNLNTNSVTIGTAHDALFQFSEKDEISFKIETDIGNMDLNFHINNLTYDFIDKSVHTIDNDSITFSESLFGSECQFISAARLGPQLSYPKNNLFVDIKDQISEKEGKSEFVVHFLDKNRNQKVIPEVCKTGFAIDLFSQVTAWEREICTNVNLIVEDKGLLGYELKYQFNTDSGRTDQYNAINVGFGLTYALPVIVAILSAKKGSILFIENPEAHLHPKGQAKLAELITLAAQAGIQIVIETHSDHIFNGIRKSIFQKKIDNGNVKVYFFELDDAKVSVSTEIQFSDNGRIQNYKEGLFDQFDNDLDELLGL